MILDITTKRHSTRKFIDKKIDRNLLLDILKCGQNYPSRSNLQPLKFILITDENICNQIFDTILWGCKNPYFKNFKNKEYSPKNYIVVCVDTQISSAGYEYEIGASIQSMLLSATEKDISSLWVKSVNRSAIAKILNTDENIIIDSLVCLGYSDQKNTRKKINEKYQVTVDDKLNMNTPKRNIKEVSYENGFNRRIEKI